MLLGVVELSVQRYRCKTTGRTFHVKPAFCQWLLWYGTDVVGQVLVECVQKGKAVEAALSGLAQCGLEVAVGTVQRWLRAFEDQAVRHGGEVVADLRAQGGEWARVELPDLVDGSSDTGGVRSRLLLKALGELYRVHHPRDGPAECERMPEFWNGYLWRRFGVSLSRLER